MKLSDTPLTDRPPIRNRYEFDRAVEQAYRRWKESGENEDVMEEETWDIHRRLEGYTYDTADEQEVDYTYIRREIWMEAVIGVMNAHIL